MFLVADLFAAATVFPIFLSLSDRVTPNGGLFGAIFGLISVVIYGAYTSDLQTGIDYLTNPVNELGLANLEVFLSALLGSAFVTILVSEIENAQKHFEKAIKIVNDYSKAHFHLAMLLKETGAISTAN